MKIRWQLLLIAVVPVAAYALSRFWQPSMNDLIFILLLYVQFVLIFPTWKQLDRIEGQLDAISKRD